MWIRAGSDVDMDTDSDADTNENGIYAITGMDSWTS